MPATKILTPPHWPSPPGPDLPLPLHCPPPQCCPPAPAGLSPAVGRTPGPGVVIINCWSSTIE